MPRNEYKKAFKRSRVQRSKGYIDEEQYHTNGNGNGYTSFIDCKGSIRYFTRISPIMEFLPSESQLDIFCNIHHSLRKFTNCSTKECYDLFRRPEFKEFLEECYILLGIGKTQASRIPRTRIAKYVRNYVIQRCSTNK